MGGGVAMLRMTLSLGLRPARDAMARIDALAGEGKLTAPDVLRLTGDAAGFVHFGFEWKAAADGALVLHPSQWLVDLITVAEAR